MFALELIPFVTLILFVIVIISDLIFFVKSQRSVLDSFILTLFLFSLFFRVTELPPPMLPLPTPKGWLEMPPKTKWPWTLATQVIFIFYKGQLISKLFFGVVYFLKKMMENCGSLIVNIII